MNHKERIQCAMNHGVPDRVPVMCQLSHGHIFQVLKISPSRFLFDPEAMAEGFFRMREMYDFDGMLVNNIHTAVSEDCLRGMKVEKGETEERVTMPDGRRYRCPYNDDALLVAEGPNPDIDEVDVETIVPVIEYDDCRVKTQKLLVEWSAGRYSVHGETVSPFDWLVVLMGLENTMVALVTEPEKCIELLERYTLQSVAFAKKQIDVGVDAMKISSPFVGSSFISKHMYERFVVPYERRLVQAVHEYRPGIPVYTHTCGFINDRLELMRSSGIDGIECLDPAPLGNVSLADAKQRIGKDMFIKGNMDAVNHLLHTTPEKLVPYVRSVMEQGMPSGGYILSTACSVAPAVDPEIMKLLVPIAKEYGRY